MAVKTITIDLEAYGLLSHHKALGQSFSQVIKAHFGRRPTASAFRTIVAGLRPSDQALDAMDAQVRARGRPPRPRGEAVIHLDSSFLIDLLRETGRGRPGGALDFIEGLADDELLGVSVHVVAELRAGAELSRRPLQEHENVDRLLSGLTISYPDARFAPAYGRLLAAVTRSGRPIAAMDLLIATAATVDDAPLVTRNVKDFSRVPGLRVLRY